MHLLRLGALLALVSFAAACSDGSTDDHLVITDDGGSGGGATTSSGRGTQSVGGAGGSGGSGSPTSSSQTGGGEGGGTGGSGGDVGTACAVDGNPGICREVSDCEAMDGYTATPGHCPGPSGIQCCAKTPNVADNPPIPTGYKPMTQSEVTPEMTDWAVMILNDPDDYPMFSTATKVFGALTVLARVEWHPPDFQNNVVHRGVTLYRPD